MEPQNEEEKKEEGKVEPEPEISLCTHYEDVDFRKAKTQLKFKMRSLFCSDCGANTSRKKRKKKKKRELKEAWICLSCINSFCQQHYEKHSARHNISANSATRAIYCRECKMDLREYIDPEKFGSKIPETYLAAMKEFISEIQVGLGAKDEYEGDISSSTLNEEPEPKEDKDLSEFNFSQKEEIQNIKDKLKALTYGKAMKGLRNLGNTCYFNSALQCLNASKLFVNSIIENDLHIQIYMREAL